MNWYDLEDDQFNELMRLMRAYHREALRCDNSKAYIAGCVVAGAALEASLLAMIHVHGDEITTAGLVATVKGKPKRLLDWKLAEMLRTAKGMNWLPAGLQLGDEWKTRKAKIGDYAEALRQTRNLVHPARYLQDQSPKRVTKRYLHGSIEILEAANNYLEAKLHDSLRESMRRENIPVRA